jgi:hypothetical protein
MRQGTPSDTAKQLGESGGGPMRRLRLELRERLQARRGERALKRVLTARAKETAAQRRDRRYRGGGMQPALVTEPAPERAERSQPPSQEQPDPSARKQVAERAEALERRINAAERLMLSIEERQSRLKSRVSGSELEVEQSAETAKPAAEEIGQDQRRFAPQREERPVAPRREERPERPPVPSTPAPGAFRWGERSRGTIVSPPSRPERPEGERSSEGEQSGRPADRGQERPRFPGPGASQP